MCVCVVGFADAAVHAAGRYKFGREFVGCHGLLLVINDLIGLLLGIS